MYVLGGAVEGSNQLSECLVAPINADGSLGAWSATTPLPEPRVCLAATVAGNRIYVVGGASGSTGLSTIRFADVLGDGGLGAWSDELSMPFSTASRPAHAFGDCMFVFDGAGAVHLASIHEDGSLGAFHLEDAPLVARNRPGSALHHGVIYLVGGAVVDVGTVLDSVEYAGTRRRACGSIGLDLLLPLAIVLALRRLRRADRARETTASCGAKEILRLDDHR